MSGVFILILLILNVLLLKAWVVLLGSRQEPRRGCVESIASRLVWALGFLLAAAPLEKFLPVLLLQALRAQCR